MTRAFTGSLKFKVLLPLGLLIVFSIIFIPLSISSSPQKHSAGTTPADVGTTPSDDFNRADGSLGPSWTNISDGKMAISSHAVTGTSASGISGDIWTAHAFTSDQYSQVEVASAQLTGTQWIGPAVRVAGRRAECLSGHLLVEQRQTGIEAVLEARGKLHSDRQRLQQRAACCRDQAKAHGHRQHDLFHGERRSTYIGR